MSTSLLVIYFIITLYLTWRVNHKEIPEVHPLWLPGLLVFKYIYAYFFLFIYTEYYGGGELTADAGRFFEESMILHDIAYESPKDFLQFLFGLNDSPEFINSYLSQTNHWNAGGQFLLNDSRNVMRANALLLFISNGSVYIHFLLFSFASFAGSVDIFQFLKKKSTVPPSLLLAILLLAPSIAFWSSSIIKEPLLMLGFFIFVRGIFDDLSFKRRFWRILVGGLLLIGFKPYVFIAILLGLAYYYLFSKISRFALLNVLIYFLVATSALYFTDNLSKVTHIISKQQEDFMNVRDGGLYLDAGDNHYYYIYYNNRDKFEIIGRKAVLKKPTGAMYMKISENFQRTPLNLKSVGDTFDIVVRMSKAGSGIEVTPIKDDFGTMILMVPESLYNTHVRPLPHAHKTWLALPAFVEKIIYLLGLLLALFLFNKKSSPNENRMLWSLGIIAVVISLIVGWTTPVVGAIVRYIIPAQAALLIIVLIKFDWEAFTKIFKSSKARF